MYSHIFRFSKIISTNIQAKYGSLTSENYFVQCMSCNFLLYLRNNFQFLFKKLKCTHTYTGVLELLVQTFRENMAFLHRRMFLYNACLTTFYYAFGSYFIFFLLKCTHIYPGVLESLVQTFRENMPVLQQENVFEQCMSYDFLNIFHKSLFIDPRVLI